MRHCALKDAQASSKPIPLAMGRVPSGMRERCSFDSRVRFRSRLLARSASSLCSGPGCASTASAFRPASNDAAPSPPEPLSVTTLCAAHASPHPPPVPLPSYPYPRPVLASPSLHSTASRLAFAAHSAPACPTRLQARRKAVLQTTSHPLPAPANDRRCHAFPSA